MSRLTLFAAFLIALWTQSVFADQTLQIDIIDVGEGDSILLRPPEGQAALVDTGNPISGPTIVNYLKQHDVTSLDLIFLTHPHFDHVGGVFAIGQVLSVHEFLDSGQDISNLIRTDNNYRWYDEFVRKRSNYDTLRAGDVRKLGGSTVSVLWPPKGGLDQDLNNNSLVLLVSYGEFRALLMGDALAATEEKLIGANESLHAQLLKAGHHASTGTATSGFLDKVNPRAVVVSVNALNINSYPNEKILERYAQRASVYRTDRHGSIEITAMKDGKFVIHTEKNL